MKAKKTCPMSGKPCDTEHCKLAIEVGGDKECLIPLVAKLLWVCVTEANDEAN